MYKVLVLLYTKIFIFLCKLVENCRKNCLVCVHQTLSTTTKLTHTSHLMADLSHTRAPPPHLIQALCAMIGWS